MIRQGGLVPAHGSVSDLAHGPLLVVLVYLVAVTTVGSLLARRTRTAKEWAVAGGGMGTAALAAGIAGTRIGGAGIYGVAGEVIAGGVWHLVWYAISTFLALALMGVFFARPYRRLGLHTVGEAFTRRYGSRRCQVLTSLCVQTEYLVVDVIEVYVTAALLRFLTGIPLAAAVVAAALVIVTYTALGGLWGAAVTNLIHCAVILGGLSIVCLAGLDRLGGWEEVTRAVGERLRAAGKDEAVWWSLAGAGLLPILAMLFSAVVHTPAASIYANFSSAARSEAVLRRSFLWAGAWAALMPVLAGIVGILTLARYGPGRGLSSYGTITTFATDVSPWVGSVAVAAILAAVVSTGGPVLLSSATLFVRDWLPARMQTLGAYRMATVVYGAVAAVGAWMAARASVSLLNLLLLGYAMVVPPAVALGYLIYWRRTTEPAAFWGMAAAYGLGVVSFFLGYEPAYCTTLVPLVLVPALSLLTPDGAEGKDRFYATVGTPAP